MSAVTDNAKGLIKGEWGAEGCDKNKDKDEDTTAIRIGALDDLEVRRRIVKYEMRWGVTHNDLPVC